MGLKTELIGRIKVRNGGIVSFSEFEYICKSMNRKVSNGERRMRECEDIEKVLNGKGAIIGYRLKKPQGVFGFIE